jgi:hypothetical protein
MTKAQNLLKKIEESTATTYDYILSNTKNPEEEKNDDPGTIVDKTKSKDNDSND